jgi:hypothetical protein
MKIKIPRNDLSRRARIFAVLSAGFFLVPALRAQPTEQTVQNRLLLIFDTSADMKKRVPAEQKVLDTLLATSMSGQLHSGDSLGVWTFDQDLHAGQFPMEHWESENAVMIASNITKFIGKQHYAKTTSFDALQPLLNQVVENSERLTTLIFCDGETEFSGTPYDAGINRMLQERQSELKKARQTFVIVLRSQLGEYVGCTMNFSPTPVNLPDFPPLPLPPAPPAPPPANTPPPAPIMVTPSLVIVGTNVGTTLPPPAPKPEPTNTPPPPITPPEKTNETNVISTPPINSITVTNFVERTNMVAAPLESPGSGKKGLLAIGTIFLVVAGGLVLFVWQRSRKPDSSLITRSMNERK